MAVSVFVGRNRHMNVTREPDFSHEMRGVQEICYAMHERFSQAKEQYAVLVSPQHAGRDTKLQADVVIISEKGLGVLELKDYPGKLYVPLKKPWYLMHGKTRREQISTGSRYMNPHEQVQVYGHQIWRSLVKSRQGWLPGNERERQWYKFHTAVCFTNVNAEIEAAQEIVRRQYQDRGSVLKKPWEKQFSILRPDQVPDWAMQLRFEVWPIGQKGGVPYQLSPEKIQRLAESFFACRPWPEMTPKALPQPYAYLYLVRDDQIRHVFRLKEDRHIIGRDEDCTILLPDWFANVSRKHAALQRQGDGVYLEDFGSTNGTFVDGDRLPASQPTRMQNGQVITLADDQCRLLFSTEPLNANMEPAVDARSTMQLVHTDVTAEELEDSSPAISWMEKLRQRLRL